MSDTKTVKVELKTTITNGEERDSYELLTFGTLQHKGRSIYLRYDEVQQDLNKTHTIVKWSPEEVFIMRSGHVKMRQKFLKDLMTVGSFESTYGTMQMLTTAKKMNHSWDDNTKEGKIHLIYDLNMQGNDVGQYDMLIRYKEETK
ncbi:DUF1934 domain-containing protein [Bacillus massiliigorillae]|uniref:DUF1934 domain-containing protein n=1 Tax=Bacillus massiliigorillae TaxID=1243664 RepID=UPI00039FF5E0|nr:DUF1934 domain-containing protein [Bacillus massiliigorillae]